MLVVVLVFTASSKRQNDRPKLLSAFVVDWKVIEPKMRSVLHEAKSVESVVKWVISLSAVKAAKQEQIKSERINEVNQCLQPSPVQRVSTLASCM